MHWFRKTIGPLLLICLCPPVVMLMGYTNTVLHGSLSELFKIFMQKGVFLSLFEIWSPVFFGTKVAWIMILCFSFFQLGLMAFIPGKIFYGPPTIKGNIPIYRANGFAAFLISIAIYLIFSFYFHLFPATLIYDHIMGLLGALNLFALIFCLFLYCKGRWSPSSSDSGTSGNFFFDYYWGTELYPRIWKWDVKLFTNSRFGMMAWGIMLLSFAAKQYELYGLSNSMILSAGLQLLYITGFFLHEGGYLRSLDIAHDRAGFYICWGCLVWIPAVYTSPAMYLIHHPIHLGIIAIVGIAILGIASFLIKQMVAHQRESVRSSFGNCTIWGKPPKVTIAFYIDKKGEQRQSFLLASGWWGISRHFLYIPEIALTLSWTLPALFNNFLPYFYVCYLTLLLIDRAHRVDKRCKEKYGDFWEKHCQLVPYKLIPFIY